jgi:hypothetical protein
MKKPASSHQISLFDSHSDEPPEDHHTRLLLDQLLAEAKLYARGPQLMGLLNFVARLRNVAPFNAMLLHIQRPGVSYVASQADWATRFQRQLRAEARPLLVLYPFGPLALVFDVLDTEGPELPEGVLSFTATGVMSVDTFEQVRAQIETLGVEIVHHDLGDRQAGHICRRPNDPRQAERPPYLVRLNGLHSTAVRFCTLVHELGHLFLGHLGSDTHLNIDDRRRLTHAERELEAEMAAYVVCMRNGIQPNSSRYLSQHVSQDLSVEHLDLYRILRAIGRIEDALGLAQRDSFQAMEQLGLALKGGQMRARVRPKPRLPRLQHFGPLAGKPPPRVN